MSRLKKPDTTLAFVDVITNGLGGMLVLFFIVVLLQTSLEWFAESSAARQVETTSQPFVVVVESEDGKPCFDPRRETWDMQGVPPGMMDEKRGKNRDWGPAHAILVVDRPLPVGSTRLAVRAREDVDDMELKVHVYPAGAAPRSYRVRAAAGQSTEVWPCLTLVEEPAP